jgi:serine/threonine protein kinase
MKKVKVGKFSFADPCWNSITDQAKDFISQLLTKDQTKRPTAEQSLNHPWIVQATESSLLDIKSDVAISALTNLQNFHARSKLKQATYAFIAS